MAAYSIRRRFDVMPEHASVSGTASRHRRLTRLTRLQAAPVLVALAAVAVLIPGLRREWEHLDGGDPRWLGAALAFEVASYAGYVTVFPRSSTARDAGSDGA